MVDDNRRWLPLATFPNSAAPAVANFAIAFLTEATSFTSNSTSPVSASDKRMRATPAKLAIRIWLAPAASRKRRISFIIPRRGNGRRRKQKSSVGGFFGK
jgi:hypothetical protein